MNFKNFAEQVIGHEDTETFITDDEEVEIFHWYTDGQDHFEYHTSTEQSGEYTMPGLDPAALDAVSQELFDCPSEQVTGYID